MVTLLWGPVFEVPTPAAPEPDESRTHEYKRSYRFDFAAGDFVLAGGRPERADGYASWVQWCAKAAITQRGAHPAYTDRYGADLDAARQDADGEVSRSRIAREITAALMAHPGTKAVSGFSFESVGDDTYVECLVEPTVGTTATVRIAL